MKQPLILVAFATLAACSGGGGGQGNSTAPVALVSLGTATRESVAERRTLYGAVEKGAEAQYTLSAPAESVVGGVPAPVGTPVKRGQLVVRLRPSPGTNAQLLQARSEYQAASQALARAERLRGDGLASDADVESARKTAQGAQAMLRSLTSQTNGLALRAPGAGYVQSVAVNPGDLVSQGMTIATISRVGTLRARFGISPAVAGKLSSGTALMIRPSDGGPSFSAPILSVDQTVDPQTRLASVYVRVPPEQGLGPGQSLTATVPVTTASGAVTVPYDALLSDGGQPYVYVVKGEVAHRHDVTTGPAGGNRVAITQGVSADDKVVTAGGTGVEDGMKVRTK
ncbi:efflux RND transporter periplasmic adaptor subunit [Novosphingobium sp. PP1Y]|uniref:efflux RND transporter periplasmic adaptor subunit n=1 Tax=Novosphingobium sp. PP1Y TaxID=702113 RepID=UPI00020EEC45|nr:efflux RND transporter periplasmic adaptor subunit [Novosphingobium sp. PP1Y]CCA92533.1 transporter, putative [Novosphingobium sp. PP1Y]